MTKSNNNPLSKNELEIVNLTVHGDSQKSIAKQLGLVAQGIEHRFPKPGVASSNLAEAA